MKYLIQRKQTLFRDFILSLDVTGQFSGKSFVNHSNGSFDAFRQTNKETNNQINKQQQKRKKAKKKTKKNEKRNICSKQNMFISLWSS